MYLSDTAIRWIIFLINPFIAMIFSIKEYMKPYAKNMFWAFCTFFGFTFAIGKESQGSDINRYVIELKELYSQHFLTINEAIEFFQNSGEIDMLRTVLSFTLSRFTDSQAILTLVYAFIFGFFYSRNIWYVFGLLKNKLSFLSKILFFALFLVMPIWQIGGFRMWTAFHVFIYGLLPFIFENKKNRLIFMYLSVLVHFSYMIPISIFLVYRLLGNRIKTFFIIFVVSFFISEFNISSINSFIDNSLPKILVERTSSYRNEGEIEQHIEKKLNSKSNWYVVWRSKALSYGLLISLIYFYFYADRRIKIHPEWKRLFSLSLLFYSAANILMNFPSGGRFLNIAFFLSLIMVIIYLDEFYKDLKYKQLMIYLSPLFIFFIIITIRRGFYTTSMTAIFGNPLIAIFSAGENMSLNDLIK